MPEAPTPLDLEGREVKKPNNKEISFGFEISPFQHTDGKYYPQIRSVARDGVFKKWGVITGDVLFSGNYNNKPYKFGSDDNSDEALITLINGFKTFLENQSRGILRNSTLTGIRLEGLRDTLVDESQTASSTSPAKPARPAVEFKLYVISSNAP